MSNLEFLFDNETGVEYQASGRSIRMKGVRPLPCVLPSLVTASQWPQWPRCCFSE